MAKANMSLTRNIMPTQDAKIRAHNFDEVATSLGVKSYARV